MTRFTTLVRRFVRDDEAATMVEYAFMLALIALVLFATVQVVGTNVSGRFAAAAAAF